MPEAAHGLVHGYGTAADYGGSGEVDFMNTYPLLPNVWRVGTQRRSGYHRHVPGVPVERGGKRRGGRATLYRPLLRPWQQESRQCHDYEDSARAVSTHCAVLQAMIRSIDMEELIERVMTEHWDIRACPCTFCVSARDIGLRPRTCYPTNPKVSILDDGSKERKRPTYIDWSNPCRHERLTEEGICRNCNEDRRGLGA